VVLLNTVQPRLQSSSESFRP